MGLNQIHSLGFIYFCSTGLCNGGWSANSGYFRIWFRLPSLTKAQNPQCLKDKKKELAVCFILILLNLVQDYFHYCITVAIVLWISPSLINIIVIVYYADLSSDMQEPELLPSDWSVIPRLGLSLVDTCQAAPGLGAISAPLANTGPQDISGLWLRNEKIQRAHWTLDCLNSMSMILSL